MSIQDEAQPQTFAQRFPKLAKDVKSFPVRPGEEPWTLKEAKELATTVVEDSARLEAELETADAELSDLLRNSGEGSGDDQARARAGTHTREQHP